MATTLAESHDAATTDRLTGIANRPAILAALFGEVERAGRYDRPLAVAFVDIDLFKAVNDTYGHEAGDVVLRGVAADPEVEPAHDGHARVGTAARSSWSSSPRRTPSRRQPLPRSSAS